MLRTHFHSLFRDISNTVDHLQEYETQQTMSNLEEKETTGQEKCAKGE